MKPRRRRPPRRSRATPAADLLTAVLGRYGIAPEVREERLATEWRRLVGPRVAAHAWPAALRDDTLVVNVESSPWLHELSFLSAKLLDRINQAFGDPPLAAEIRLQLGPVRGPGSQRVARARSRQQRRPLASRPLPEPARGAALEAIEAETAGVADPELRQAILEARRRLGA